MRITYNNIFEYVFVLFVAVITNSEWQSNGLIWWGVVLLLILSYLFSIKGKVKIKLTYYKMWVFTFVMVCFLSFFIATDKIASLNQLKTIIILNCIYFILEEKLISKYFLERILLFLVCGLAITLLYILFNIDLNLFQLAQVGKAETGVWNGNDVALKAVSMVPLVLYFFQKERSLVKKIIFLVIFLLSIKVILMTGSRKGILMLIFGISGFITLRNPKKILKNGIIGVILVIIGFITIMKVPRLYELIGWRIDRMIAMFKGVGEVDSSALLRKTYINIGKKVFWDSPVLGHGVANFSLINLKNTGRYTYSHNNFIEILVGLGMVGFISYYWFYFYLMKKYFKRLFKGKNSFLTNVLFINFILYFGMHYGFVSYYDFIQGMVILLLYSSLKLDNYENKKIS